jgi:hypothetical protein
MMTMNISFNCCCLSLYNLIIDRIIQTNGFQLNVVMMWFPVLQLLQPVLSHSTSIDHYLILCTTDKG